MIISLHKGLLLGTCLFWGACHQVGERDAAQVLINGGFFLNEREISIFERRAMSGNAEAAAKLAGHYLFAIKDRSKAKVWLLKGAEMGDVVAQANLGAILIEEQDRNSQQEGIFWLQKAAAQGDRQAQQRLTRLVGYE